MLQRVVNSVAKESAIELANVVTSSGEYCNSQLEDLKEDILLGARFVPSA